VLGDEAQELRGWERIQGNIVFHAWTDMLDLQSLIERLERLEDRG
jgi:hypothetical protein